MIVIASGTKGIKDYELLGEPGHEFYVAKFREDLRPKHIGGPRLPREQKVYYKASDNFFEIVADCQAWLNEVTPVVGDST